jgi:hypothetical protein
VGKLGEGEERGGWTREGVGGRREERKYIYNIFSFYNIKEIDRDYGAFYKLLCNSY